MYDELFKHLIYKAYEVSDWKKKYDEFLRCLPDLLTIWQFISHVSNFISNTINSEVIPDLSKFCVTDGYVTGLNYGPTLNYD